MIKVGILSVTIVPISGWGNITHEFCSQLERRDDISFTLYLPRNENIPPDVPYAHRVTRVLPEFVGSFAGRNLLKLFPFWLSKIDLSEVDLIHSLVDFPYAVFAYRQAKKWRKPFLFSGQGTYSVHPFLRQPDRILFQQVYQSADAITVPSEYTKQRMLEASGTQREIRVLHNAVNYDRFQCPQDLTELRMRFGSGSKILLGVGALKYRKGFDILIKAFKLVQQEVQQSKLVIVGDGNSRDLQNLAEDLGVSQDVHLVGAMYGDELVKYFQLCDLYVHTPRVVNENFEGFGIVYLEAGACGKPVVAARSGGVPDAVLHNKTGLLVEEGNVEETAEAIIKILKDEVLANQLGVAGREYARHHTWEWFCSEIIKIYHSIL